MTWSGSDLEQKSNELEQHTLIRTAVQESHQTLLRSVAILVANVERQMAWPQVMEIANETLNEAVQQALKNAHSFDVARSVTAWVRGISARLLLARRRAEARNRRCVSATALGEEAWASALEQRSSLSGESAVAQRLDLEEAMARLTEGDRQVILLRYFKGLDGEALAEALGTDTTGAARVRVCRALQALRTKFSSAASEVGL